MPYDESLAARVAARLTAKNVRYETRRMMGGLAFMVRGKMCVGVESRRLMARLHPDDAATALQRPGCRPMDFTGRPMRGFVFIDAAVLATEPALATWLDLALAFNPLARSSRKRAKRSARAGKPSPGQRRSTKAA